MRVFLSRKMKSGVVVILCLFAGAVFGQHNYQSYLLGDRASGMGGAVVASADSVDSCYYNPAGLARLPGSTISLSGSLYGRQSYRSTDGLFAGEDVRYDSFVTIPTTVGGIWKASDRQSLGFAVFMPNRTSYNEMRSFRDNEHIYNYNADDQTLWIGPSAGWKLTPDLAVGASIYAVYRSYNEFVSLLYREADAGYSRGRSFNDWCALAALGLQCRILEKLRFGLMAQSPSLHVWGNGAYQVNLVTRTETESVFMEDMETDNRVPAQIRAGIAWQEPRVYTLGLDVSYYFGQDFDLQSWGEGTEYQALKIRREEVVNFNLGAEYYWRGIYPLRAGFFTDFSAAPSVNVEDIDNTPRLDGYGFSASIGKNIEHMSMNFGVIYVIGSGRSLGWSMEAGETKLVAADARQENIYLVVNTAYVF